MRTDATLESKPSELAGFVTGTLVHTDKGLVPIQEIEVGALVLSKPENEQSETAFKNVVSKGVYETKTLWLVQAIKHWSSTTIDGDRIDRQTFKYTLSNADFMATPDQTVWVVGQGVMGESNLDDIIAYPEPHWKRVDQLKQYEIIVNKDRILFYIERAQPLYQHTAQSSDDLAKTLAWYQTDYYVSKDPMQTEDIEFYNFDEGRVIDMEEFHRTQSIVSSQFNENQGYSSKPEGQNVPLMAEVFNLDVADVQTYFVTKVSLLVQQ